MTKARHACANSERDTAQARTTFASNLHCSINYYFDGFHSIVITASSLPLPLHTGQSFFTRSRSSSPQKEPLPWQYLHKWPVLMMVSFRLPPPTNAGGVTLMMSFFTLIFLTLKHIVLKIIPQCSQSFFLYRAAVFAVLWKCGHPLLTVELVAFLPHLVAQVTLLTHLPVFRSHDLTVFA